MIDPMSQILKLAAASSPTTPSEASPRSRSTLVGYVLFGAACLRIRDSSRPAATRRYRGLTRVAEKLPWIGPSRRGTIRGGRAACRARRPAVAPRGYVVERLWRCAPLGAASSAPTGWTARLRQRRRSTAPQTAVDARSTHREGDGHASQRSRKSPRVWLSQPGGWPHARALVGLRAMAPRRRRPRRHQRHRPCQE